MGCAIFVVVVVVSVVFVVFEGQSILIETSRVVFDRFRGRRLKCDIIDGLFYK